MNIANQVSNLMSAGIEQKANRLRLDASRVSFRIQNIVSKDGNAIEKSVLKYDFFYDNTFQKESTFLEVIGKNIDILQYEKLATPYLKNTFNSLAKETGADLSELSAFISKKSGKIEVHLFRAGSYVKTISIEQLLN